MKKHSGVSMMGMNYSKGIVLKTAKGRIRIRSFCSPEEIRACTLDRQFGCQANYKSFYTSCELLAKSAQQTDTNIVLALASETHIVGYGVLAYPDPGERWANLGSKTMMEITGLEVCRSWRSCRIASGILEMLLVKPQIEERIVYMVGYTWTWDLGGARKTSQQYREMLLKLFERHGFAEYRTNEPNICLNPQNLFMCRVGKNISQTTLDRFKWLRFGLSPWRWQI